tara:strand:+ start:55 stop:786 length:732 start_codon:yes stop_codon:yes gene_type:complete
MILNISKFIGKLLQIFPKYKFIKVLNMRAKFFIPINNHYVSQDLINLSKGKREPKLFEWLNSMENDSVYFDVGTSYGQEVTLVSSMLKKNIKVFGFDCSLQQSHICAMNKKLNNDNFKFIFAAVSDKSGEIINISSSSDIHIKSLFKKNIHYNYDVMTLSLDDFSKKQNLVPTHLKIDVDGAESEVLKGASNILKSNKLKQIYIEIDDKNINLIEYLNNFGFENKWESSHGNFKEIIFIKSAE